MSSPEQANVRFWLSYLLAALGGIVFGYNLSNISGVLPDLVSEFHLSTMEAGLVPSCFGMAAGICCFVGGPLADKFGRRLAVVCASSVVAVGALFLAFAQNLAMLVLGRLLEGAGIGLISMVVPMYIAECSPKSLRGKLVSGYTIFICGGILLSGISAAAFSYLPRLGWRFALGLGGVPAAIQVLGFLFIQPETPRWLAEHGREDAARKVIQSLRTSAEAADQELTQIKESWKQAELEKTRNQEASKAENSLVILRILRSPPTRRALILGCTLQFCQQLTGISVALYYGATIIQMSGVTDPHMAIWYTCIYFAILLIMQTIGALLVDRVGRRPLTLLSLLGCTLSAVFIGVAFYIVEQNSPAVTIQSGLDSCGSPTSCSDCISLDSCGFCFSSDSTPSGSCVPLANKTLCSSDWTWTTSWCPSSLSWLVILGLVLFFLFYPFGMGIMPWTVNTEIYPQWARGTGNGISVGVNWGINLVSSLTFLPLAEAITRAGVFYFYGITSGICLVFFWWTMPETKGRSLEDVEQFFDKPWFGGKNRVADKVLHA